MGHAGGAALGTIKALTCVEDIARRDCLAGSLGFLREWDAPSGAKRNDRRSGDRRNDARGQQIRLITTSRL